MKKDILALDVGGTKTIAGLVSVRGRITQKHRLLTRSYGMKKNAVLRTIFETIRLFPKGAFDRIGIGITGQVRTAEGVVTGSPNLPRDWKNVLLKKLLEQKFKKRVYVDNDVHCSALAESIYGAGRNYRHVVSLTLGTGIGGGLVIDKKLYRSIFNCTEFGHMVIASDSPPCSCGMRGHFEALASGRAVEKSYFMRTKKPLNSHEIEKLANTGDRDARAVFKTAAHFLAIGLANIINMLSPDIIIIGGGLARAKNLLKPALGEVKLKLLYDNLGRVRIVRSKLGYDAGLLGAALIAQQGILNTYAHTTLKT